MKSYLKIILYAAAVLITAVAVTFAVVTARHNRSLTKQVTAQSTIIDSLLARRMELIDVQLYVTDKSKNVIYGKYNKGHIYMPQERKYILKIDSTSVMVK